MDNVIVDLCQIQLSFRIPKFFLRRAQFFLFLFQRFLVLRDQLLCDFQQFVQIPGTLRSLCPRFCCEELLIDRSFSSGFDSSEILKNALLGCNLFLVSCIHPVFQLILYRLISVGLKYRPQDLRAFFRFCVQEVPEFSLGNHCNLFKLFIVNVQQFLHRIVDLCQALHRGTAFFVKDSFLRNRCISDSLQFFSYIGWPAPDMETASLM